MAEMIHSDWKIEDREIKGLSHIATVLSQPPEYYQRRIQKIGFTGKRTKLLDAACGSGIWALAGSYLNREVQAIDSNKKYLAVGKEINQNIRRKNVEFRSGQLEELPYKNEYFDYVICYNAWMYTNRVQSLGEMRRVLKPGGRIYLGCIAGLGYYLMLILQGLNEGNRGLIFTALGAIKNRVYMTEKESRNLLKEQGFKILGLAGAGLLGDPKVKIEPDFRISKIGFWNIYEILAMKPLQNTKKTIQKYENQTEKAFVIL